MSAGLIRELYAPYPFYRLREPWLLYEHAGRHVLRAWERVCADALGTGDAEPLHQVRERYQTALLGHLKVLDGYLMLLTGAQEPFDTPPNEHHDLLGTSRDEIRKHYDALFPRWQTLEDLEGILLDRITPSNEALTELAKRSPAPASWYEQPDPLTPEG